MRSVAVILMLSSIFLAGCDTEKERLKKEVAELKSEREDVTKLKQSLETQLDEEARLDRAIYWSQWCDFVVPTCPLLMVKEGREAIQKDPSRIGGNGNWMISKLMVLFGAIGSIFLFCFVSWKQLIQPGLKELNAAKAEVGGAKKESERILNSAKEELQKRNLELDRLKNETNNEKTALKILKSEYQEINDHLGAKIDVAEGELEAIQKRIKDAELRLAQDKADLAGIKNAFK